MRLTLQKACCMLLISAFPKFLPRCNALPGTVLSSKKSLSSSGNLIDMIAVSDLCKISLSSVENGALKGTPEVAAETLWASGPALIYVVRRPGCALCREEAIGISSRFKSGEFKGAKLFGVIKELAPIKGAETDEILGVNEFQTKYFLNNPLYHDPKWEFCAALGNKSLWKQSLSTWNPFQLYSDYQILKKRMESQGIEGNLVGEGFIKGGVLIVCPTKGVVYQHNEMSGSLLPFDDIKKILDNL